MSARMSSKWAHRRDSRSLGRNRARDSRSPSRNRARGRGSPYRSERSRRRDSSSPSRSKRSRWDSPPRSQRKASDSSPRSQRRYRFDSPPRSYRSELDSPRSRRKDKWDSPPRASPFGSLRRNVDVSPRSRRDGLDDGYRRHGQGPAGLVFLCSTLTKGDCFRYGVFGLPLAQRDIVERIVPGTKLFLFNFETKELFGIFEAASPGGVSLVPEAFGEFRGSYASQVLVRLYRECLPLADYVVKDVLKDNLSERGKFDCELSADQVLKLVQLFSASGLRSESAALQVGSHLENADVLSSRNVQVHMDTGDASIFLGSKLHGESAYPNQADGVGQGTIEEVDQLALKYLQNDPGFFGNPSNSFDSFLHGSSGHIRDTSHSSIPGLPVPQMNHVQREDTGSVSGVPPRMFNSFNHESSMQRYLRESGGISSLVGPSGSGGSLAPIVNGALLPVGIGSASTAERKLQDTSEGSIAMQVAGHLLPGPSRNDKGLLPLPSATLNMPPRAGISQLQLGATARDSFQATGNVSNSFGSASPAFVPSMILPGSSLAAWHLQANNSVLPHAIKNPQLAPTSIRSPVNFLRPKKANSKKNASPVTGFQMTVTHDPKENNNQPATA